MGILLLTLYFSVKCLVDLCVCLCPSVLSGDLVAQSLLLYEVFCRSLFVPLSFFLLVIVLSSFCDLCFLIMFHDYTFDIIKPFLR